MADAKIEVQIGQKGSVPSGGAGMGQATKDAQEQTGALQDMSGGIQGMLGTLGVIAGSIAILSQASSAFGATLKGFVRLFLQLIKPIADVIAILLRPFLLLLQPIVRAFRRLMRPVLEESREKQKEAGEAFKAGDSQKGQQLLLESAGIAITGLFEVIVDAIAGTLVSSLKSSAKSISDDINEWAGSTKTGNKALDDLNKELFEIGGITTPLLSQAFDLLGVEGDNLADKFINASDAEEKKMASIINLLPVSAGLTVKFKKMQDSVKEVENEIKNNAIAAFQGAGDQVSIFKDDVERAGNETSIWKKELKQSPMPEFNTEVGNTESSLKGLGKSADDAQKSNSGFGGWLSGIMTSVGNLFGGGGINSSFGSSGIFDLFSWIPKFQQGGIMPNDGLAFLHKNERITPANQSTSTQNLNVNIDAKNLERDIASAVENALRNRLTRGGVQWR